MPGRLPIGNPTFNTVKALLLILVYPDIVYIINRACNRVTCLVHHLPSLIPEAQLFMDSTAYMLIVTWLMFQAFLAMLPIGNVQYGHPLANAIRLSYRCNGVHAGVMSLILFYILYINQFYVTIIYDKYLELLCSSALLSALFSLLLFIRSSNRPENKKAHGGNTGVKLHDYYMGRELNPRFHTLDLKFFIQTRPSLIGWMMINCSFLAKGIEVNQYLSIPLLMSAVFQTLYALVALRYESSLLSNMPIVHNGLGYKFMCRHLVWVPFMYTLNTRYLLEHENYAMGPTLILSLILNLFGLLLFKTGSVPLPDSLRTRSLDASWAGGSPMIFRRNTLISQWWGLCRHPASLGMLIMVVAWTLPCGSRHVMTYFYLTVITLHTILRHQSDTRRLQHIYGERYRQFCERIPHQVIPRVL